MDVSSRKLGKKSTDGGGFTLYDTNTGGEGSRTHYITGFNDKCALKVTGAVVVFGGFTLHEFMRYHRKRGSYSEMDEAYEEVKKTVCRVKRGEPCEKRLTQLEKRATFVSICRDFGESEPAFEMLLFDGEIYATELGI